MTLLEHVKQNLQERVLSPGFNKEHEKYREMHRQDIHDILRSSYKDIGGYGGLGHGSEQESKAIHDDISSTNIKMTRRNGKISSVNLYRDMAGRKSIAAGTDGSVRGKEDFIRNKNEDNTHKRAWGETSGKMETIMRKLKAPVIPPEKVAKVTGKTLKTDPNGEHYVRDINGHPHRKIAFGHMKDNG